MEMEMRGLQESHGRCRQDTDWWLIGQKVKRMWGFEDQNHSRFPAGQLVDGTAIHWEVGHRNNHTGLKAAVRLIPSSFPMPMMTWTPSLEDICSPLPFLPALHQLQLVIFWALSFLACGGWDVASPTKSVGWSSWAEGRGHRRQFKKLWVA